MIYFAERARFHALILHTKEVFYVAGVHCHWSNDRGGNVNSVHCDRSGGIIWSKEKYGSKKRALRIGHGSNRRGDSPHARPLLFDIEVVFFLPWAIAFRKLGIFGLLEMVVFIIVLLIGYVYAWKKGALEWE